MIDIRVIDEKEEMLSNDLMDEIFSEGLESAEYLFDEYEEVARSLSCISKFKKNFKKRYEAEKIKSFGLDEIKTYQYCGKEYSIPKGYRINNNRLEQFDHKMLQFNKIYEGILLIDKTYSNIDDDTQKSRLVNIRRVNGTKEINEIIINADVLNDSKKIAKLSNQKVLISIKKLSNVCEYLTEFCDYNRGNITNEKSTERLGWLGENYEEFLF